MTLLLFCFLNIRAEPSHPDLQHQVGGMKRWFGNSNLTKLDTIEPIWFMSGETLLRFDGVHVIPFPTEEEEEAPIIDLEKKVSEPRLAALHIGLTGNRYIHLYENKDLQDTIILPKDAVTLNMDFFRPEMYMQNYQMLYKIDPLMDSYQLITSSNQITVVGLRSGEYPIHVRIKSINNGSLEKTWTWLLIKEPSFVETQLFYTMILLLIGGLITYVSIQHAKRENDERILRKQISRDLHDEVGGLLTGISMQADLLAIDVTRNTASSIATIGQYSREAIQMMDDIIWAIDVHNNFQWNLQERMEYLSFQMLEPKEIRVTFEGGVKTDRKIPQIVRQNTYLIFKEILHNIVKHAQAEWVSININIDTKRLKLIVQNDGSKYPTQEEPLRKGQGAHNMATRARQINASITTTQNNGLYKVELIVNLKSLRWRI